MRSNKPTGKGDGRPSVRSLNANTVNLSYLFLSHFQPTQPGPLCWWLSCAVWTQWEAGSEVGSPPLFKSTRVGFRVFPTVSGWAAPLTLGLGEKCDQRTGKEEGHILETAGRVSLFPEAAIPWRESTWRGKEKPEVQPRRESSVFTPADCLNFPRSFLQAVHKPVVWWWCVSLSLYVSVSVCLSLCPSVSVSLPSVSLSTQYLLFTTCSFTLVCCMLNEANHSKPKVWQCETSLWTIQNVWKENCVSYDLVIQFVYYVIMFENTLIMWWQGRIPFRPHNYKLINITAQKWGISAPKIIPYAEHGGAGLQA